MKTAIKIHGRDVEFSDTPPTRPGAYWWKYHDSVDAVRCVEIYDHRGTLMAVSHGIHDAAAELGGLWSAALVPVTEVGDAWNEGFRAGNEAGADPGDYVNSRARRVVEGVE